MADSVDAVLQTLWQEDPQRWVVTHDSGALRVGVGPDGSVENVHFEPRWFKALPVQELGEAILETKYRSDALRREEAEAYAPAEQPAEDPALEMPGKRSRDRAHALSRLNNLLTAFDQVSEYREAVNTAAREETTLTSASGRLSMQIRGGTPQGLTLDPYGVELLPTQELEADVIDLFARSRVWLESHREDALKQYPELAAIARH